MHKEILEAALIYYRQGRSGDAQHVKWICRRLETFRLPIERQGYDYDIIYAVAALHDIGYSQLPPGYDPFALSTRRKHQLESAKLARAILLQAGFPKAKIAKTLRIIRHHDDWAFGRALDDPEWRVFSDLDFSWEASAQGFDIVRKFLKQERQEFLKTVQVHYRTKQEQTPFHLSQAKKLFLNDLRAWQRRLQE